MSPRAVRAISTVALGYALAFVPILSAQDEKPELPVAPDTTSKGPDWKNYAYVSDVVGEIVKADGQKLTLRVTWFVQQVQNGGNNRNRRPNLSGNNRNFRNPFAQNNRPRVTTKEEHHDYELEYVPETLIRTKHLPPKTDEKGLRVNYTQKELDEIRAPQGVPWYASSPSELKPGTIVEVIIIRDRSIPIAKAKEDDLRVKYAIILGTDPNPPKDITGQKTDSKKKN